MVPMSYLQHIIYASTFASGLAILLLSTHLTATKNLCYYIRKELLDLDLLLYKKGNVPLTLKCHRD